MSSPYTGVTVANYNADPPADDGTRTAANQLGWAKHKTKIGDPLKVAIEAINANVLTAFGKLFGNDVQDVNSNYQVTVDNQGQVLSVTGTRTITLLPVATAGPNFAHAIMNAGAGLVAVDGSGAELVNGIGAIYLGPGEAALLFSDGASWTALLDRIFPNRYQTQGGNYTVVESDNRSLIGVTATATITLPVAATAGAGFRLLIRDTALGTVTIDGAGAELVNGAATLALYPESSALLLCDGAGWTALLFQEPREIVKVKLSDESVTSDTTLQNDNDLQGFPLDAGQTYELEAFFRVEAADAGPDFKFLFNFSQTPQFRMFSIHTKTSSSATGGSARDLSVADIAWAMLGADELVFNIRGSFRANATTGGTLDMQWAQNSSSATPTFVKQGSWMKIRKLQ